MVKDISRAIWASYEERAALGAYLFNKGGPHKTRRKKNQTRRKKNRARLRASSTGPSQPTSLPMTHGPPH